MNFFRWLGIHIMSPLIKLIPNFYRLFYDLANAKFFDQDIIKTFSQNIYVLLSVVMLFALAIKALESIVNPDLLFDSKKGFASVIKRSIIALVLIIFIPFGFSKFYEYQEQILVKSLIEKIILGVNIEGEGDKTNTADVTGAGQMLAGLTFGSVLYLPEGGTAYEDMQDTIEKYNLAISEDIKNIDYVEDDINEKVEDENGDKTYVFEYHWLESIVVCIMVLYLLALFCIDTAERVVSLGFLQLTAPISVLAYIYGGNEILKNWWKETSKIAVSVFIRIASLAFLILVLSNITSFTSNYDSATYGSFYSKLICLLIIIGTLIFIKEAPKLVERVFGVSVGGGGGIAGRLGNMAGVGNVAKKAWETVRNPLAAGAAIATGVGALGAHVAAVRTVANRTRGEIADRLRERHPKMDSGTANALGHAGAFASAALGFLGTAGAVGRGVRTGATTRNLSGVMGAYDRYTDTHPEGSTFGGRLLDDARAFVGLDTRADANMRNLDKEAAVIDARIEFNNGLFDLQKTINDAAKHSVESENSGIKMAASVERGGSKIIEFTGNYNQIQERINAERVAAANANDTAKLDLLNEIENNLYTEKKKTITNLVNKAMEGDVEYSPGVKVSDVISAADFNTIQDATRNLNDQLNDTSIISSAERTARGLNETGSDLLIKVTKYVNENLITGYDGEQPLNQQKQENQRQRQERDAAGNLTEQGRRAQDTKAREARNNNGNSNGNNH